MIKGISVSLDGVYFLNGRKKFLNKLNSLGITEFDSERIFLKSDVMNKIYKLGKLDDEKFWDWAIKRWNLNLSVHEAVELLISGYEINTPVAELIKNLKSKGYKTLMCSNSFPARITGLEQKFGFLNNFDEAVFSYERGVDKPNKLIFERLIEISGLKPEELMHIDENEKNLSEANSLGIKTHVYTSFEDFSNYLQTKEVNLSSS